MKSLHITNAWHASSGGIATFYRRLLQAAEGERRNVVLVVPAAEDGEEPVGTYGRIYSVRAPRALFNNHYRFFLPHHYLWPGAAVPRILRREEPDLVEICDKYTLPYLAGLLRRGWLPGYPGRPTVAGLSCERMDDNVTAYLVRSDRVQIFIDAYLKHVYFPMCDHHIAVSPYTADELQSPSRGHRLWRGLWICPMGVDRDLFRPEHRGPEARGRLLNRIGGGDGTVLLLYCGRLAPEKNLDLLARLMTLLSRETGRDYRLLIAGDGILRESFLANAESKAPGRVHWLGFTADRHALADLYAGCDIFVHPNPAEPFGIAPLEAMAAGLPLVAPQAGGVLAYANGSNAWLAAPLAECFASAIRNLLDSSAECRLRADRARLTAEEYSWPAVAARYLRLYEQLDRLTRGNAHEAIEASLVNTLG